ncbi:hypothetical protein PT277_05215 [Acetobacteraceae bacterium ESL0709]|nr:hypothetical protein [Acetobacteraceae bacterium ESL0697]MDF7678095.1 hypothetical protein [Acetobacteraceae bacterium ESL0709]
MKYAALLLLCALFVSAFPLKAFSTVDSLSVDRPDNNAVAMDAEQNFRVAYNNGGFELLRKQIDECYYKNLKRIMNDHESPGTPEERIRKSLALKACYLEDEGRKLTQAPYCVETKEENDDVTSARDIRSTSYLVLLFPYNWEGEGGVYISTVRVSITGYNCPYYINPETRLPQ